MIINNTANYTITSHNENQFILNLKKGSYECKTVLYESIVKTLPHSFSFINPEKQELHFQASSTKIHNLLDFLKNNRLSWEQCMLLIGFLSKQIQELEKRGHSLLGFNLQDILMIDETVFLFVNNEYLFPIHNTISSYITLIIPFQKPYFSSPELLQLTKLPSKIHYKSSYYSLASLVVYCLLEEYIFKGNEVKTNTDLEYILKPIYSTKMYWFLKRCLVPDPTNRKMLFI